MSAPDPAPSESQVERIVEMMQDLDAAAEALPAEEREMYEAARQSIVDARRYAERTGHQVYVY